MYCLTQIKVLLLLYKRERSWNINVSRELAGVKAYKVNRLNGSVYKVSGDSQLVAVQNQLVVLAISPYCTVS